MADISCTHEWGGSHRLPSHPQGDPDQDGQPQSAGIEPVHPGYHWSFGKDYRRQV